MQPEGKHVCAVCGLCCDGVFFDRAKITADEVERCRKHGLELLDDRAFSLPCTAHRDDHCAIYEERPACCRHFRCAMLERYEAGEIDLDAASLLVERVRALAAASEEPTEALRTLCREHFAVREDGEMGPAEPWTVHLELSL